MALRLAKNVQVRKENWGLLFYAQTRHRIFFVKSGDWLDPQYFNGTWTFERLVQDVTARTHTADNLEHTLRKLTDNLLKNGMIVHELC
jgi:putative mycofactocin binding protein MftB